MIVAAWRLSDAVVNASLTTSAAVPVRPRLSMTRLEKSAEFAFRNPSTEIATSVNGKRARNPCIVTAAASSPPRSSEKRCCTCSERPSQRHRRRCANRNTEPFTPPVAPAASASNGPIDARSSARNTASRPAGSQGAVRSRSGGCGAGPRRRARRRPRRSAPAAPGRRTNACRKTLAAVIGIVVAHAGS